MPPRIPTHSLQACSAEITSLASSGCPAASTFLAPHARRPGASPSSPASSTSLSSPSSSSVSCSARSFSTTPNRQINAPLNRQGYLRWLKTHGNKYKREEPGRYNYMVDIAGRKSDDKVAPIQPFPTNADFKPPRVLDEEAREMIWKRVFMDEEPVKVVSAELGVDIRRVAAVVRMKTIEKEWQAEGKKLATPYSKAILSMLPRKSYPAGTEPRPLEPLNEIHVHSYTMQQLFVPTSESRQFTREDAAKAFHHTMLSADERIPHKEYVEYIKRTDKGIGPKKAREMFVNEASAAQTADEARDRLVDERNKKLTTTVPTERFEFRFKKMWVDDAGKDGRSRKAVGWRYGAPYEDRKKDQVKIPTQIV